MKLPTSLLSTLRASLAAGLLVTAVGCPSPDANPVEPPATIMPVQPEEPPYTIMPVRPDDPRFEPGIEPVIEPGVEPNPIIIAPVPQDDPVCQPPVEEPFDACPGCGRG